MSAWASLALYLTPSFSGLGALGAARRPTPAIDRLGNPSSSGRPALPADISGRAHQPRRPRSAISGRSSAAPPVAAGMRRPTLTFPIAGYVCSLVVFALCVHCALRPPLCYLGVAARAYLPGPMLGPLARRGIAADSRYRVLTACRWRLATPRHALPRRHLIRLPPRPAHLSPALGGAAIPDSATRGVE